MAILACGLFAAAAVLALVADSYQPSAVAVIAAAVSIAAAASVGLLVALRADGHPIGFLLLAIAALAASWAFVDTYARFALLDDPGALPAGEWALLWATRRGR